jgi:hypothetical protein
LKNNKLVVFINFVFFRLLFFKLMILKIDKYGKTLA